MDETDRLAHWDGVYSSKRPDEVSWFQARPDVSLELIAGLYLSPSATILDVGGGASTLVDHLLAEGCTSLTVLDLAKSALSHARARLGNQGSRVRWIAADVTDWVPDVEVDVWHDRAVLHFLTTTAAHNAYARTLKSALRPDGWAIIAGFAPGGPAQCSGLDIVQHDAASLATLLGNEFVLKGARDETHATPWGTAQAFRYHLFRRRTHSDGQRL